jgi:hypothetical protein
MHFYSLFFLFLVPLLGREGEKGVVSNMFAKGLRKEIS